MTFSYPSTVTYYLGMWPVTISPGITMTFDASTKPDKWLRSGTLTVEGPTADDRNHSQIQALDILVATLPNHATHTVHLSAQGESYTSWRITASEAFQIPGTPTIRQMMEKAREITPKESAARRIRRESATDPDRNPRKVA